jgi:hypothetical protein
LESGADRRFVLDRLLATHDKGERNKGPQAGIIEAISDQNCPRLDHPTICLCGLVLIVLGAGAARIHLGFPRCSVHPSQMVRTWT